MSRPSQDRPHLGSLLVVEDDQALAEVLAQKMQAEGYSVITADTTQDAISRLRNQRFDCVILDMVLRKGCGEELIPVLRAHWKNGSVPVIVTSGSLEVDLVKRIATHVKRAFVKPYDIDAVVRQVQAVTRPLHLNNVPVAVLK